MSTPKTSADEPIKNFTGSGAESPTTVRPLDMEDDDVQESGIVNVDAPASRIAPRAEPGEEEVAPPKPPRPLSLFQQAEATLKEAFPTIDAAVVKAVLMASGGEIEPAFNALLSMSDPDAEREPIPPLQPPRPSAISQGTTSQSQLEADELYARQLAEHYDSRSYSRSDSGQRGRHQARPSNEEDNRNFFDDDLPVIKENLQKGFLEAQTKFTGWISNVKKKFDGDDDAGRLSHTMEGGSQNAQYGRRSGDNGRRSGDYNRYDADPQVLGDDFAGMQLTQDAPQRRTTRPLANPDLFKPTPNTPKTDARKVSFQGNEHDEIYGISPKVPAAVPTKQSKWQPLSNVASDPMAENDPFSLGDSEDEKESKDRVGGKEIKMDETERSKKAAAEVRTSGTTAELSQKPSEDEVIGSKEKVADEEVTGNP